MVEPARDSVVELKKYVKQLQAAINEKNEEVRVSRVSRPMQFCAFSFLPCAACKRENQG